MKKFLILAVILALSNSGVAIAQQMNCDHHDHDSAQVCDEHGKNCSHNHGNCKMHNHDCMGDHGKNCQHGQQHGCCGGNSSQSQDKEE